MDILTNFSNLPLEQIINLLIQKVNDEQFLVYLKKAKAITDNSSLSQDKILSMKEEIYSNYTTYLRIHNIQDTIFSEDIVSHTALNSLNDTVQNDKKADTLINENINISKKTANTATAGKNNALPKEFVIGATIFSIIGAFFILYAFVLLGMYFMNSFLQGIMLYLIPLLIIAVSEIFLYKKSGKLSSVLTSIGICGLFLATRINFSHFKIFNSLTSVIIMTVITIATFLLGKIRQLNIFKILGLLSCYFLIFPITDIQSFSENFVISIVLIFLMNIACIFMPVKKSWFSFGIVHLIINTIFSIVVFVNIVMNDLSIEYVILFIIISLSISNLIFYSLYNNARNSDKYHDRILTSLILYSIYAASVFIALFIFNIMDTGIKDKFILLGLITISSIIYFLLQRHSAIKYIHYYFLAGSAFLLLGFDDNKLIVAICMVSILLSSRIIHFYNKYKALDLIFNFIYYIFAIAYMHNEFSYIFFLGILASIILIKFYPLYYEFLLTIALLIIGFNIFFIDINIIYSILVLFIFTMIFNHFKSYKSKYILAFNIFAVIMQALYLLIYGIKSTHIFYDLSLLYDPYHSHNIINSLYLYLPRNIIPHFNFTLLFIITFVSIIFTFTKKNQLNIKNKELLISLYLTYMIFISRAGNILISIFLIVLALICIIWGFVKDKKNIRLYGLLLALFVCVKIVLFDYAGADKLYRMILFFVVGLIALIISFIYIILEKNLFKNKNNQ